MKDDGIDKLAISPDKLGMCQKLYMPYGALLYRIAIGIGAKIMQFG